MPPTEAQLLGLQSLDATDRDIVDLTGLELAANLRQLDLRYNRQWPDMSLEAAEASHVTDLADLDRLREIDPAGLSDDDRLNHELFERTLRNRLARGSSGPVQ